MSIGGINGFSGWWQWQNQATGTAADSAAADNPDGAGIRNTGTVTADGALPSFMQTFSADLQAMLSQLGNDAGTAATGSSTSPAQGAQPHHHHHHRDGVGANDLMQNSATQLVGDIGQSLQGGSLSADQINQSASVFAADVMQALQSYGATAANGTGASIVA